MTSFPTSLNKPDSNVDLDATLDTVRECFDGALTVYLPGGHGFPSRTAEILRQEENLLAGKRVVCSFVSGFSQVIPEVPDGRLEVSFLNADLSGRTDVAFVPMQYRRIWDRIWRAEFDLAVLRVVADSSGNLRFGLGVDFQPAGLAGAKRVLLEVVHGAPVVEDSPPVQLGGHESRIRRIDVDWSREVANGAMQSSSSVGRIVQSSTHRRIGRHVASLVRDGDCIQMGIGAIPDAALDELSDHSDLGCHSGMIGPGVQRLHGLGVLTGSRKSIDQGKIVTGFVFGGEEHQRWASECSCLALRPVNYTHDARVLAQIKNLVSINSAVEVNLAGEVNAEMIGSRQVSGTGGSVDFARGAALSEGGRSIIALPATAKGGKVTRIVAGFVEGSRATLLRTDVDYVVTEYGVARLHGCDTITRARNLIRVAAPEFRESLAEASGVAL